MFMSIVKAKEKTDCKAVIQCEPIFEPVGMMHSVIIITVIVGL